MSIEGKAHIKVYTCITVYSITLNSLWYVFDNTYDELRIKNPLTMPKINGLIFTFKACYRHCVWVKLNLILEGFIMHTTLHTAVDVVSS